MKMYYFILMCLFLLVCSGDLIAQTEENEPLIYKIELQEGDIMSGEIISQDTHQISLKIGETEVLSIELVDIKSIEIVESTDKESGAVYIKKLDTGNYFFVPNGYGLRKGESNYQNTLLWIHQFSYGVSDQFSIGGGIVPISIVNLFPILYGVPSPVWINPKLSIPIIKDEINISVGAIAGTLLGEKGRDLGMVYSSITLGNRVNNVSVGTGYGYADRQWLNAPVFTLSGVLKIGKKCRLITENYTVQLPKSDFKPSTNETVTYDQWTTVFSLGLKGIKKRGAYSYGLFVAFEGKKIAFGLPWFSVHLPLTL